MRSENYWQAVDTCQKVNGSLATFVTNEELQFILKIEVDFDDEVCRDQCKYVCSYPRFTAVCPFLFFFFLNMEIKQLAFSLIPLRLEQVEVEEKWRLWFLW